MSVFCCFNYFQRKDEFPTCEVYLNVNWKMLIEIVPHVKDRRTYIKDNLHVILR